MGKVKFIRDGRRMDTGKRQNYFRTSMTFIGWFIWAIVFFCEKDKCHLLCFTSMKWVFTFKYAISWPVRLLNHCLNQFRNVWFPIHLNTHSWLTWYYWYVSRIKKGNKLGKTITIFLSSLVTLARSVVLDMPPWHTRMTSSKIVQSGIAQKRSSVCFKIFLYCF